MIKKSKLAEQTDQQIDEAVVAQAEDEQAWGDAVEVGPYGRELSLRMPVQVMQRMSLQARKEGFSHVEDWAAHQLTLAVKPGLAKPAGRAGSRATSERRDLPKR